MIQSERTLATGFEVFPLAAEIHRGIAAAGFTRPWPIQLDAIPAVLAGRDVLGLAQTGTGKTAAFALPILQKLVSERRPGPRALILAPTRELAMQIDAEIRLLAKFTRTRTVTVFGGVSARGQIDALRRRPDVIVACPGRLLDLMGQGEVRLEAVETLVVDEADQMFDMGFLPDIRRILAALPPRRQNLMFSATMPREIRILADRLLVEPVVIERAPSRPAETIEHALYPVLEKRKVELLQHLLDEGQFVSAIVFTRTKHRAKKLGKQLDQAGRRAIALQGNMTQAQRDRAMNGFRSGQYDILVATDIASRGIDVAQVSHVINFDVPTTPDAYTHRIGRTGRAERSGQAYTFVTPDDVPMVRAIERQLGAQIRRCSAPGFEATLQPPSPEPTPARREPGRKTGGGPRRGAPTGHPQHARGPSRTRPPRRSRAR